MCYRETAHYVVLCDRCGLTAPEGAGWSTPSYADEAALEAGWAMTMTEHLCPACSLVAMPDDHDGDLGDLDGVTFAGPRPALTPSGARSEGSAPTQVPATHAAGRGVGERR